MRFIPDIAGILAVKKVSVVKILTNFNIDIEFELPAFHRRLLAWFIDVIVQLFYLILAIRFYRWLQLAISGIGDDEYTLWAIGLVLILPFLTYHLIMEISLNGQSIGKKIMGMKVISEHCGRPTLSQFIIRWLMRTSDYAILLLVVMLPYASFYGSIIYWGMTGTIALLILDLVLVNAGKQQRLGDILAHTLLVNTEQKETIDDTIFLEVQQNYQPVFPQVLQLSDKDLNALKNILDTSRRREDMLLAAMAAEKIKKHLQIVTAMEPEEFLETLLKDYNSLTTL